MISGWAASRIWRVFECLNSTRSWLRHFRSPSLAFGSTISRRHHVHTSYITIVSDGRRLYHGGTCISSVPTLIRLVVDVLPGRISIQCFVLDIMVPRNSYIKEEVFSWIFSFFNDGGVWFVAFSDLQRYQFGSTLCSYLLYRHQCSWEAILLWHHLHSFCVRISQALMIRVTLLLLL